MKLYTEKLTPEDEWAFEEIRKHASAILRFIEEPDDVIEVNRLLAELEAYPSFVLTLTEVK